MNLVPVGDWKQKNLYDPQSIAFMPELPGCGLSWQEKAKTVWKVEAMMIFSLLVILGTPNLRFTYNAHHY